MPARHVLVIDSPARALWSLAARLQAERLTVTEAASAADAREALSRRAPLIVVHHAAEEAAALMSLARERHPGSSLVAVIDDGSQQGEWAAATTADAVITTSALAAGAERIMRMIAGVRHERAQGDAPVRLDVEAVAGDAESMARVRTMARRLAAADTSAILSGEPGTGRALVARVVHDNSSRAEAPFVRFDCGRGAGRDVVLALFGDGRHPGAIERADGGTVLLERVDRLSPAAQLLVLRLLEESSFRTADGFVDLAANVRVLATTDRRLEGEVEAGRFRRDLQCRLGVVVVDLPPLRQRGDDVLLLARLFANAGTERPARAAIEFEDAVVEALCRYPWPGNVHELELVMARALLLASDATHLGTDAFPGLGAGRAADEPLPSLPEHGVDLATLERHWVVQALDRTGGNQTRAARLLGLRRDQMRYRMLKHGLQR